MVELGMYLSANMSRRGLSNTRWSLGVKIPSLVLNSFIQIYSVRVPVKMLRQDIFQVKRDLYDSLYVRSLLQWDMVRRIKSGQEQLPRSSAPHKRKSWQLFLDDLCLLCDSCPGGKTTTAIAVEQRVNKIIFLVANNSTKDKSIALHLRTLLNLVKLAAEDTTRYCECANLVFEKAVKRSPRRVHNYMGRLLSAISSLRTEAIAGHDCNLPSVHYFCW